MTMHLTQTLERNAFISAGLLALLMAAAPTMAQEPVGTAETVVNTVTGEINAKLRRLDTGNPVFRSEVIAADADSRGEIALQDGSKIMVGAGASISLDDFVVSGNDIKSGTIQIAKGALRFISKEKRSAIAFKTPLSTIGIRGTIFDIYVEPTGETRLVVLQGAVRACALSGRCIDTRQTCDVVQIRGPDEIEELPFLRSRERGRVEESQQFDLTERQQRFGANYRAPTGNCSSRAAREAFNNPTNTVPSSTPAGNIDPPDPPAPDPYR